MLFGKLFEYYTYFSIGLANWKVFSNIVLLRRYILSL